MQKCLPGWNVQQEERVMRNLCRMYVLLLTARHNPVYTAVTCQSENMLHSHLTIMSCAALIHTLRNLSADAITYCLNVALCLAKHTFSTR